MPTGLQVFDASGNIILDTNNRITRLLGSVQTVANVAGSISVPEFAQGTPWSMSQANAFPVFSIFGTSRPIATPTINTTTNTISWPANSRASRIYYGVY